MRQLDAERCIHRTVDFRDLPFGAANVRVDYDVVSDLKATFGIDIFSETLDLTGDFKACNRRGKVKVDSLSRL